MKQFSLLKKKYLLMILVIFNFNLLIAQSLQIEIKDKFNQPIKKANILIKDAQKPHIIKEFTISKGGISLINLKKIYKFILIEVTANGFYPVTKLIKNPQKNKTYNIDFILKKDEITKLDEVIVTAKKRPFTIKKDTVKYNVNSYRDGSERKIQDLIKKLPGIEVNTSTGEIKYKGKSVETVLLEGDNLFGYNYSLGTKNINVDMVEQVQAIENYSENPLLKGIENGDKVALNLTLKKGKIDFSGNIDLGVGFFENEKQALNINSNILGITKNYKSFATLAYNNIGVNHSPFDYFGFDLNFEELKEKDFFAQKIIPETRFSNTLDNKRVNINNQYFGNYNAIFKINKRLKVKTNLYYINDKITSEQLFENSYIINNEEFTTTDNTFITKKPKQYRGDLEIKYNFSKTSLIEYDLRIRQENIKTPSTVLSNNNNNFEALLNSEDFYLKQKLLYTKKISDKKAFQFSVLQSTNNISQAFQINPSVIDSDDYTANTQESLFKKKYIETQATLLGSSKKDNKYTFSVGGIMDNNKLQSELFGENLIESIIIENGTNNLEYFKKSIYQLGAYHFNIGKWKFSPSYSLNNLNQVIYNRNNGSKNNQTDFIFEPSLNIRYRLNSVSFLSAKAGYNKTSNAERYLFLNQILINNRTTISNTASLELQESLNYSLFYYSNDLYKQLQINASTNYQKTTGNFFTNSLINENTTQINYFYLPQNNSNLSFNFQIAKYIPFLESTVKLSSNYSISEYKNIVNNSELRNNKSQFLDTKLFMRTAFDGFINFENTINLSKSISESDNSNQFINESLNNVFKIILKPTKKWFILLSSDYFLPNRENKLENYMFLDASIRYRPKNKKIEFNFVARNLLNETNFEQIQTSDFSTNIYRTNILPRNYLLNMTYNF
jgi:hypothetical protein